MFVGHYGASFAGKALNRSVPMWVLFAAVQLLDVFWSIFVLLGIEKVRIVPGITRTNPLDLYFMPYTHSLVGAIFWALALNLYSRAGNSGLNGRAHTTVGNHMQTDNDPAARNVSLRIYGGCVPKLDAREQYFRIPNEIESLKLFLRYLSPVSAFTPAKVVLYIHGTDCSRASRLGVGLPWVRWLRSIL